MLAPTTIEPAISVAEAQAFVRIESGEEEALVAGLIRTATALCEAFLNQVLIARPFSETRAATGEWQRLSLAPVRSIDLVELIAADGSSSTLAAGAYGIDIDSAGDGWFRLLDPGAQRRVRVSGIAGIASGQNEVPEPIRQGVVRLVGHLFASRDGDGGEPPAAVTAMWRPYRRLRMA